MSATEKNTMNLIKAGTMNLKEVQQNFAAANASYVTIQDWGVCYNSGTQQLSEYCTVVATNPSNSITGVGMIAYTSDGSSMLCVQYNNGFNDPEIAISIGTTLYNPNQGNQILCIVYGWTTMGNFYFTKTLQIVDCQ